LLTALVRRGELTPPGGSLLVAVATAATVMLAGCGGSSADNGAKHPELTFRAALQLEKQGDISGSAQLFQQVIKAQPDNYVAMYNLGVIAQEQHNLPAALYQYGRALKVNPRYVPALFNAATIYALRSPLLAIAIYRRILTLQRVAPTAYLGLGKLEIKHGQPRRGVRDLAAALSQDPSLLPQIPAHLRALVKSQVHRPRRATPTATATGTAAP
jgi:tetratricopeptide (TPR) repeat protein